MNAATKLAPEYDLKKITVEFCIWLMANFDRLMAEMEEK